MHPILSLCVLFVVVKTTQLTILAFSPTLFDISSQLLPLYDALVSTFPVQILNNLAQHINNKMLVWDAVYFTDLFYNDVTYEHQYVFCPLWWRLVRAAPVDNKLVASVILANCSHFGAAIILYYYTIATFAEARMFDASRLALAALAAFILSPAAMFMTAPYSEPAAALFSFAALYLREISIFPRFTEKSPRAVVYVASGLAAAVAFGFRANCLLLGIMYVVDLWNWRKTGPSRVFLPLVAGLVLGLALVGSHVTTYWAVCRSGARGEWCDARVPSLFAYAQAHYWNNGFLRYWTANNIPNFAFAAPTIALSIFAMRYFRHRYPVLRAVPVLWINGVFVVLALFFWHVQIVTRVHTFLPVVYWLVGGWMTQRNEAPLAKWALGYFVVWGALQTALFGAFLPPA